MNQIFAHLTSLNGWDKLISIALARQNMPVGGTTMTGPKLN